MTEADEAALLTKPVPLAHDTLTEPEFEPELREQIDLSQRQLQKLQLLYSQQQQRQTEHESVRRLMSSLLLETRRSLLGCGSRNWHSNANDSKRKPKGKRTLLKFVSRSTRTALLRLICGCRLRKGEQER